MDVTLVVGLDGDGRAVRAGRVDVLAERDDALVMDRAVSVR
jgi:hypothetical protein